MTSERSVTGSSRRLAVALWMTVLGSAFGLGAFAMAVITAIAGHDAAFWWMAASLLLPTIGYACAESQVTYIWERASDQTRYRALRRARPVRLLEAAGSWWMMISIVLTLGGVVWVIVRLAHGAGAWFWVALPLVFVLGFWAAATGFFIAFELAGHRAAIFTDERFKSIIDGHIADELANSPYLAGAVDWNAYWLQRIAYFARHPPADRSVAQTRAYILESRSAAGLPPVRGLTPETS